MQGYLREKQEEKLKFLFLAYHCENFEGYPWRGNVTKTSLLETEFAFVFPQNFSVPQGGTQ